MIKQRSPLAEEGISDEQRIEALLYSGTIQECLTESLYWIRYAEEIDGEKSTDEDPLNLVLQLNNRALALLTFKESMTKEQIIKNAMKRDTDTKYDYTVVFLIPEELARLKELGDLHGFIRKPRSSYQWYWRVEGPRLTVNEVI